ncbi:MAG: glycosyltransferase family 4 protein [Victivallales bacterium]|nr:glycosyltransferase family 4 protein [Victivallales bacterium]
MSELQSKLKICHVITRMNIGGAEENTLLTCMGLLQKGHDVTLVTGPSTGPEGNLLTISDTKGLKIVEIPDLIRNISPYKDWRAYHKLLDLFMKEQYDVVHTHASKAGILGRFAAFDAKVPFITHTVHGQAFHAFQSWIKNRLFIFAERLAANRSDKIYAVAQAMIDQCVAAKIAPAEKYKVVYSGMDLSAFMNATASPELRDKLGIPEGAPIIGVIARMFPQKGYEDFLRVVPEIAGAFPEARFLLVGDGTMRSLIEHKVHEAGLDDRFIYTGMVPPQEVCRYLPFMSVLVHLSYHEGLPRTAVQALAAKVPVVAYPVDGTPEVVEDGVTGCLPALHNLRQVSGMVISLLRNAELRRTMGETGQGRVKSRFDTQKMVDTLNNEYITAIEQFKNTERKHG